MHIPDGFIDGKTAATAAVLTLGGLSVALRQVQRELPPRRVPLLGLAAAFLFAAQMVNFPVAGGTSGHLIGGVLVAVLLGPSGAVLVLSTVLIVQCFLFADGGVLSLGANIFNMAILGAAGGYAVFRLTRRWLPGAQGRVAALAFAGWCSTVFAAVGCAAQLAWSGTVPWRAGFAAMVGVHTVIGLGEGLISALVWLALLRIRPDLAFESGQRLEPSRGREISLYGLLAVLGLALFVTPLASHLPDGLEAVAASLGFEHQAVAPLVPAPVPDYLFPGVQWSVGATALAAAAGSLIVFGLALALGRLVVKERDEKAAVTFRGS